MRTKRRKRYTAAVLVAALVTVCCNFALDTEDWTVASPRLPETFDGMRITLLTDLHGARFGPGSRTLLQAVEESMPDLIAISGDLADELTNTDLLEPLLQGLCAIAPTCYVTGNHEWSRSDTEALLTKIAACGVQVLRGDYLLLEQDGQVMVLAGTDDPNGYADAPTPAELMTRIRSDIPGDPYILLLHHRNNTMALWKTLQPDLVLAGHGHGGVIRLPVVGGLLGVDRRFFPDDCEGLYTQGRTTLAVSRGLGGVRLWNRPHLPTVVLRREKE